MSEILTQAQSQSITLKPLIEGIDIHNADPAHEANAAALRKLPFQRNIFNLLARSTGLFIPLFDALNAVFNGKTRTIGVLDWQLIVLRLAGTINAEYEFYVNEPLARQFELGDDKIDALRKGLGSEELFKVGRWTERQRCLVNIVDESVVSHGNKEETIARAKKVMTEDEIVEVFIVLGLYDMIGRITKGLQIQEEPAAANMADLKDFINGFVLEDGKVKV